MTNANSTPMLRQYHELMEHVLADGVAESTKAASAELLDANPLYPGLTL